MASAMPSRPSAVPEQTGAAEKRGPSIAIRPNTACRNGKPIDYCAGDIASDIVTTNNDGEYVGPSEIIATPVCLSATASTWPSARTRSHGHGRGMLHCIDATQTGDMTKTGKRLDLRQARPQPLLGLDRRRPALRRRHAGRCTAWTPRPAAAIGPTTQAGNLGLDAGGRRQGLRRLRGRASWCWPRAGKKKVLGEMRLGSPVWCHAGGGQRRALRGFAAVSLGGATAAPPQPGLHLAESRRPAVGSKQSAVGNSRG